MKPVPQAPLGGSGRTVSRLGLGCASYWAHPRFPERRARAVFETALECGITLFDTGSSYAAGEAERRLGRMLAAGGRNDPLFIATKAGTTTGPDGRTLRDFSPRGVTSQVEASLERLNLEQVALLQLHGPQPEDLGDDLLGALERLRRDGKVALLGVNADSRVLERLEMGQSFDVVMPFVSLVRAEGARYAARAAGVGLGVLAAEPLARMRFAPPLRRWLTSASGFWYLARAAAERVRNRAAPADDAPSLRCLRQAMQAPDWSRAQIALAWVLARPGISGAVFGSTRPEHVRELSRAATRRLPSDVEAALTACLENRADQP